MKTSTAFKIAVALFIALPQSLFGALHPADEKSPRYDADHPKPGEPMDAEKLGRIAWGSPATNGLRAGCYFEPTREAYADGDVVRRRVVFQNSGKAPVLFTVGLGGNDDGWTVVDDRGQEVSLQHIMYSGLVPLRTFRLQPGQATEIDCMSVLMGTSGKLESPADTAVRAKPGTTCFVRWTLSIAETKRVEHGKAVPVAGAWHGKLTTGQVHFRIVEKGNVSR